MTIENQVGEVSQEQQSTLSPEVEQEARSQGWVSLEEFRDDKAKWVDADTFVQRGREINPILRKHNAELKKELAKAREEAQEAIQAAREFREFQKEQFEKKKIEYVTQINSLKAAKKEAISSGDGDRAVELDEAIDALKEEQSNLKAPKAPEPVPSNTEPQLDPVLAAWIERNQWYGKDTEDSMEATELANGLANVLRRKNPTLKGQDFLDQLDEALESRGIKQPKRSKAPNPVEGASSSTPPRSGGTGKKSYHDLPDEAKAACDRFVKQKLMTKEDYVSSYFE